MNGSPQDEQPLLVRYDSGATPLVVQIQLDFVGSTQIVPAILRPDLPVSVIAAQWAASLGLSEGAAVLVQIATSNDAQAELWGPCELLTPQVSHTLDQEVGEDFVGGLLLGQDFLKSLIVTLLGPASLIVLLRPTD